MMQPFLVVSFLVVSTPIGDLADLINHRSQVPGADDSTPLLAVSRSGVRVSSLTVLGPQELLQAWR
jgi:hypothetical protein